MGTVLHFMPEEAEKTACGALVYLCDEYTDDRRRVDCGRCKKTKQFLNYDPARFDVDVWDFEGDIIDWHRSVTAEKVEEIRETHAGDLAVTVVVNDALPAGH